MKNSDGTPKEAAGVSTIGGTHIILCPAAFQNTVDLASAQNTDNKGKRLQDFDGLSSTMLHEATHCAFRSKFWQHAQTCPWKLTIAVTAEDYEYGPLKCMVLASKSGANAQKNADSYTYFAIGECWLLAAKQQLRWDYGVACGLADT